MGLTVSAFAQPNSAGVASIAERGNQRHLRERAGRPTCSHAPGARSRAGNGSAVRAPRRWPLRGSPTSPKKRPSQPSVTLGDRA